MMIFAPIYMFVSILENMAIFGELVYLELMEEIRVDGFVNTICMIPFAFLLQHFYRAERYDATPDEAEFF